MSDRPTPAVDALRRALDGIEEELPLGIRDPSPREQAALDRLSATMDALDRDRLSVLDADLLADELRSRGYLVMSPPDELAREVPVVPGARSSDAGTSHAAAVRALPRARSVAFAMLRAFEQVDREVVREPNGLGPEWSGLTADEAGALAERYHPRASRGAWRRMSELAALGLIEPVVDGSGEVITREGLAGAAQRVHRITAAGRRYVAERTAETAASS